MPKNLASWRREGNPLQYSCLENSMDKGAWWAAVHGVPKTERLTFSFQEFGYIRKRAILSLICDCAGSYNEK